MSYEDITDEEWAKRSKQLDDFTHDVIPKLWELAKPDLGLHIWDDYFSVEISDHFTEELIARKKIDFADFVESDLRYWYPGEQIQTIEDRISSLEKLIALYKSRLPQLEALCDEFEEASEDEKKAIIEAWDSKF
jgi:hypothetical protein